MKNIFISGGRGMLGFALIKELTDQSKLILSPGSDILNLTNKENVDSYIANSKIDCVYHLAARVGGVKANTEFVGSFYDQNIAINTNVLSSCLFFNVPKVVSVLSTCVYPDAPYVSYPLTEDQLHLGPPHDSNFGYAYAKRMLDVQTRAYRKQYGVNYVTVIPNNLFGKHDNFHLGDGHVIPALMRKIWEAKLNNKPTVEIWGDGSPLREFTYAGDIARILIKVSEEYNEEHPSIS